MTREEKNQLIDSLAEQLTSHDTIYVADISDLDSEVTTKLRALCHKQEVHLQIVKNTLLKKAMDKVDKDFNDLYGHQAGDQVLRKISQVLKAGIREDDIVARYGGEEFTIILVNADKNDCIDTAERIRSNIENFQLKNSDGEHDITVSIGFASFPRDGENYKDIFANADKAMYEAKQAGKNQVTMYQS